LAATTGFAAAATGLAAATTLVGATGLGAGFAAVEIFAAVTFAAVFAVFSGIALLLFFEDLAAEALAAVRASLTVARARPLGALRLAAAAFLEIFEVLCLRDFCDTACARNSHAPV